MADENPVAWIGVFDGEPDPEFIWHDEAKARRWINTRPGVQLAPLFVAPALTDAERQAIKEAADAYEENNGDRDCERIADTLHGLLDRIGHQDSPVTEPLPVRKTT